MLLAFLVGCASPPPPDPGHATKDEVRMGHAQDRLRQGMTYANQRDYPNAIKEFQASIDTYPTAEAYSNLGVAYMQTGKNNLALDAFKKAEGMAPGYPMTEDFWRKNNFILYNIAALYSVTDKTDLSLQYLDRALGAGFSNYDAIRFDPDLANVRGDPEFRAVMEKHKVFLQ